MLLFVILTLQFECFHSKNSYFLFIFILNISQIMYFIPIFVCRYWRKTFKFFLFMAQIVSLSLPYDDGILECSVTFHKGYQYPYKFWSNFHSPSDPDCSGWINQEICCEFQTDNLSEISVAVIELLSFVGHPLRFNND